jgi:hypothetical protein
MDAQTLLLNHIHDFSINGELEKIAPFGCGHINQTFVSEWKQAGISVRYTHQRINSEVFRQPDRVMSNIEHVTRHIARKEEKEFPLDWKRRVLRVVHSRDGKPWVRDSQGGWWRTYFFIEDVHTLNVISSAQEAAFLGRSIGRFHKQFNDFDGTVLFETIPDFHDMRKRYARFREALLNNSCKRAAEAAVEISFFMENEERGCILSDALSQKRLPLRVCHNDTKMNNILLDDRDSSAVCIIDLDTVMPGTVLFDTGDLIRTVTSREEEDSRDLSKVIFDRNYFEALMNGYLSEALEFLTSGEKELLAESGRTITQIMALRFLTDYLEGDHYYHISRHGHNLDRCRNQIALIKSMDLQWDVIMEIIKAKHEQQNQGY